MTDGDTAHSWLFLMAPWRGFSCRCGLCARNMRGDAAPLPIPCQQGLPWQQSGAAIELSWLQSPGPGSPPEHLDLASAPANALALPSVLASAQSLVMQAALAAAPGLALERVYAKPAAHWSNWIAAPTAFADLQAYPSLTDSPSATLACMHASCVHPPMSIIDPFIASYLIHSFVHPMILGTTHAYPFMRSSIHASLQSVGCAPCIYLFVRGGANTQKTNQRQYMFCFSALQSCRLLHTPTPYCQSLSQLEQQLCPKIMQQGHP